MRKLFLVACLLLMGVPLACAQSVQTSPDVLLGPVHSLPSGSDSEEIIGVHPDGYYSLVKGKAQFTLERLDASLQKVRESQFTLGPADARREYEYAVQMQGNVYLFSSLTGEGKKKNNLYAQVLNRETLLPEPTLVKVGEMDAQQKKDGGSYLFGLSPDSTKLLVYALGTDQRRQAERISFRVLDEQLQVLRTKDVDLAYDDELFAVRTVEVDDQGRVAVAGIEFTDKPKFVVKDKPNYRYHVLCYLPGEENPYDYVVEAEGKFISGLRVASTGTGKWVCSGFYSETNHTDGKGIFYQTLSTDRKAASKIRFGAFDEAFVAEVLGKKRTRPGDEIPYCKLDYLVLKESGGAMLVGEVRYSVSSGNFSTSIYEDIVVINISSEGAILWSKCIAKYQKNEMAPYFCSYFMASDSEHLYLLFSDNGKNTDLEPGKTPAVLAGMSLSVVVSLVTLDERGTAGRTVLMENDTNRPHVQIGLSKQLSRQAVILQGKSAGKYCYNRFKPGA